MLNFVQQRIISVNVKRKPFFIIVEKSYLSVLGFNDFKDVDEYSW